VMGHTGSFLSVYAGRSATPPEFITSFEVAQVVVWLAFLYGTGLSTNLSYYTPRTARLP